MDNHHSYNIIFAGTPLFAAHLLKILLPFHHILAVYTQPDRQAGRGRKIQPGPVKALALEHHLPVFQPQTLRNSEEEYKLASLEADLMIVAAYGLILPKKILTLPKLGCINVHASLLPRWRGAAPIQRALLAGDTETGITIMQMDEGLDTGTMLYKKILPIEKNDTSYSLENTLTTLGGDALLYSLSHLKTLTPEIQDNTKATYAHKITKEDAQLDWQLAADVLHRQVRAFNPRPVAYTLIQGEPLRIWETTVMEQNTFSQIPGTILDTSPQGIDVATGHQVLRLLKIQLPGGKVLSVADILNSRQHCFTVGQKLGNHD